MRSYTFATLLFSSPANACIYFIIKKFNSLINMFVFFGRLRIGGTCISTIFSGDCVFLIKSTKSVYFSNNSSVFLFFFRNWIRPVLNENCFDHCFGQLFNNFNFFTGCWASIIMYADIFWHSTIPPPNFSPDCFHKILYFCGNLFLAQNVLHEPLEWGGVYIGSWFYLIPLDRHLTSFFLAKIDLPK